MRRRRAVPAMRRGRARSGRAYDLDDGRRIDVVCGPVTIEPRPMVPDPRPVTQSSSVHARPATSAGGEARAPRSRAEAGNMKGAPAARPRRPGGGGKRAGLVPTGQPLTAPPVMPRTKYRWREKNTTRGSAIEMNAAGPRSSQPAPNWFTRLLIWTVIGRFSGRVEPRYTNATSRSFQTNRNWKIASAAMAGTLIGSASRKNAVTELAPSMYADSKTSLGSPPMKFRSRKIANGSPYAVWASHTERNSPATPSCPYAWRIGMNVVWRGTTSSPTTITNSVFLNGKFIQANAYAANAAMKIGMIVAGIVMNRLLMNPSGREVSVSTFW